MSDTVQTAIDAFLAFRSRQIQRSAWENTMRQMSTLPRHLIADVDPHADETTLKRINQAADSKRFTDL